MAFLRLKIPLLAAIYAAVLYCEASSAQNAVDLIELDLEDLMNIEVEVESAGKNKAKALDVPYAAHLITKEDIEASGVTHLADALALAPGVAVDKISAAEWSVAIRGSGGQYSRFVLVLVDGRTVYNTIFSGVNWDELNISLPNIERIEIIRGPNAAAWGANAVNGIINIITKASTTAKQSQAEAHIGDNGQRYAYGQVAGSLQAWDYSLSAHVQQQDGFEYDNDTTKRQDTNARFSSTLQSSSDQRDVFFTADIYQLKSENPFSLINDNFTEKTIADSKSDKIGFAIQYRYKRQINQQWSWQARLATENIDRKESLYHWDSSQHQMDFDLSGQYEKHLLSTGVNTRISNNRILTTDAFGVSLNPEERSSSVYGMYLSDVWDLTDSFQITLAARTDFNELSKNVQVQPSIRGLWLRNNQERFWLAVSRASGTTARAFTDVDHINFMYETDPSSPQSLPVVIQINDISENFEDVNLTSTEIGYRKTYTSATIDLTAFHFNYQNVVSTATPAPPNVVYNEQGFPSYVLQTASFTSEKAFSSHGFEISTRVNITQRWSLQGHYAYLDTEANTVSWRHSASMLNTFLISSSLKFNWLSAVKRDEILGTQNYSITNLSLQWQINSNWGTTLAANNLGPSHKEMLPDVIGSIPSFIGPSYLIKTKYSF